MTVLRADPMAYREDGELNGRWVCHVYTSDNRDFARVYADSEEMARARALQLARRMNGEEYTVMIRYRSQRADDSPNEFIASIYHADRNHHGMAPTPALALLRAAAHWDRNQ